jgi:hypothetical protein
MGVRDRATVRLCSVLSILVGLWGLASLPFPFGVVGGVGAALCGLGFGVLSVDAHAWGRWRRAALVGIAISSITFLGGLAEVAYFVIAD